MLTILADDNLKCILLNKNDIIPIQISLKFVPKNPIDYKPVLVQVMAWRRTGDKPLPELMLTSLLTHICDIRGSYPKQLFSLINSGKDRRLSGFWLQLRFLRFVFGIEQP